MSFVFILTDFQSFSYRILSNNDAGVKLISDMYSIIGAEHCPQTSNYQPVSREYKETGSGVSAARLLITCSFVS